MPLPETGICSETAAVEATSLSLDLTVNSASSFTWSNDFYAAVRNHSAREGRQESRAMQPRSPCKAMVQNV